MITNTFFSIWSKQSINFYFDAIQEKKIWDKLSEGKSKEPTTAGGVSYKQKPLRAWKNLKQIPKTSDLQLEKFLVNFSGCAGTCFLWTVHDAMLGMLWRAVFMFCFTYNTWCVWSVFIITIFWDFSLDDEKFYPPDRARCDDGISVVGGAGRYFSVCWCVCSVCCAVVHSLWFFIGG